jgi:hypothetical protein
MVDGGRIDSPAGASDAVSIKRRRLPSCQSRPMLRSSTIWQVLGVVVGLIGVALVGWSAWLYHFAAAADTTDETSGFWIVVGSFVLVLAGVTLFLALHSFRRGRQRSSLP